MAVVCLCSGGLAPVSRHDVNSTRLLRALLVPPPQSLIYGGKVDSFALLSAISVSSPNRRRGERLAFATTHHPTVFTWAKDHLGGTSTAPACRRSCAHRPQGCHGPCCCCRRRRPDTCAGALLQERECPLFDITSWAQPCFQHRAAAPRSRAACAIKRAKEEEEKKYTTDALAVPPEKHMGVEGFQKASLPAYGRPRRYPDRPADGSRARRAWLGTSC